MKTKATLFVVALYIFGLLFIGGVFKILSFDKNECYAKIDTKAIVNCSEEDIQSALNAPATHAAINTGYDTYLEAYFANLTENFGYNYKGSCTYVAASMLLSYFDNYYSDNIIPEKYDTISDGAGRNMNVRRNSPGVMNDNYLYEMYKKPTDDITAQEYYNYLLEYENCSFHAKLIIFANQMCGLYNFDVDKDKSSCGISMTDLIRVIQLYLYYERGYDWGPDFWFKYPKSKNEETIKQFIIDQIDSGVPACVSIGKLKSDGTKSYHAVVAYAHDDSGNIFVHSGWHSSYYSTKETIYDLGYDFYDDVFSLNFYVPEHIHSNNYAVTKSGTTSYYCYCSEGIVTYSHKAHNYIYDHTKLNNDTHYVYCSCDDFIIENHSFTYEYGNATQSYHKCYCKCGAEVTKKHTWTAYYNPNMIGEYVQCKVCKYIKKLKDDEIVPILPLRTNISLTY